MEYEKEFEIGKVKAFVVASGGNIYVHIGPVAIILGERADRKALIAALVEADARMDADRKDDVA